MIKVILYILFFYYGFKILTRIFTPFLLRYATKKMQEKFKNQMRYSNKYSKESQKKEGEIHVKSKRNKSSSSNSNTVGDYVDFEEVED